MSLHDFIGDLVKNGMESCRECRRSHSKVILHVINLIITRNYPVYVVAAVYNLFQVFCSLPTSDRLWNSEKQFSSDYFNILICFLYHFHCVLAK